jgi:uncharacterized membrane protein
MKFAIRVTALTLVVAAAVAGNSLPKNTTVAVMHKATVPGPVPLCNPFTQSCPNIR